MAADDPMAQRRRQMVAQLRRKGLHDERVLAALGRVPRHEFVPWDRQEMAYADEALAIEHGQAISQPYTVGYQTEWLDVFPGARVLEVGTGTGYQAAVLAEMGATVFSIERLSPLYEQAQARLNALGYVPRIRLRLGDGSAGWPEEAPFDRILVTAAAPRVPAALLAQLRPGSEGTGGGRLVAPVGTAEVQTMTRLTCNRPGDFVQEVRDQFRFVPLVSG